MTKPTIEERLDAIERLLMKLAEEQPWKEWGHSRVPLGAGPTFRPHPMEGVQLLYANVVDAIETALKETE